MTSSKKLDLRSIKAFEIRFKRLSRDKKAMSLFFRFIHFHLRISRYLVTWKKICTFRFSMYVDNIKLDNIMQQNLHI